MVVPATRPGDGLGGTSRLAPAGVGAAGSEEAVGIVSRVDSSGFITPPPGLIPPRHDTDTHTERMPPRSAELPAFNPPPVTQSDPAEPETRLLVVLPTGARIPVDDVLLVGRNPVRFEPYGSARLLSVDDPQRSVSKTHAVLVREGDDILITDLHSTNGVSVLDAAGRATALDAGVPARLAAGDTALLGSFRLRFVVA